VIVGAIWRYPVKSMRGERLDACGVGPRGLDGDRRFAVVDAETGVAASAKHPRRWGRLLEAAARTRADGGVSIETPAGSYDARDAARPLSRWLGRDVRISDTPAAGARGDKEAGDYALGGGAPGTFFDFGPVHLISSGALAALGGVDARRFRPNLVIEAPDGFAEDTWLGRTLAVGGARLRVIVETPRCVIPTLAHGELPADPPLLKAIAQAHSRVVLGQAQPCAGAYALVEQPGRIAAGDAVEVVA
jgi:uncharacterized protein YcbX